MKTAYIFEKELDEYSNISKLDTLSCREDVATLLDVYFETLKTINFRRIAGFVSDDENFYYCVVGDNDSDFDLYQFIRDSYVDKSVSCNCVNARYLFPTQLSRGVYDDDGVPTSNISEDDDVPTSYMDVDDSKSELSLLYAKDNMQIKVSSEGVLIGRSMSKVDFAIRGNTNVGRVHCKVYRRGNKYFVHDMNSLNGTFVNNNKVHSDEDVQLYVGDVLMLADEEFKVV